MTHSGEQKYYGSKESQEVLIPLLLDDPLWDYLLQMINEEDDVLIPLLLDDPLWGVFKNLSN